MLTKLKNLPTTPLVIGGAVTAMGCILMLGIVYALAVPPSRGTAQSRVTPTRRYITATPIMTRTPTPTTTPTDRPTDLPTDVPTNTPVQPTYAPVTSVPPTAVPPTNAPPPPTVELGSELGLDNIILNVKLDQQGRTMTIPFYVKVHNANAWAVPFGYLGVAAQDQDGVSVAFRKLKINSELKPDEAFVARDFIKIYKVGQMNIYFVICLSANDDMCDQPGADYRLLAGPHPITITGPSE